MKENRQAHGPHFLGIGAPRSGTTWLHAMLDLHPEVWLPPIKEVHYFDSIDPTLDEGFDRHLARRRIEKHMLHRMKHYLAVAARPFYAKARIVSRPEFSWDLHYFAKGGDLEWYLELFDYADSKPAVKLRGEITPAYFMLSDETISLIRDKTPIKKFVVLLRDPVDALWSMVRKRVRDGRIDQRKATDEDWLRVVQQPDLLRRYSYADNLERWFRIVGREAVYVGFYEDIRDRPAMVLRDVCSFLGVRELSDAELPQARRRVNSTDGINRDMPASVRIKLRELMCPQIEKLGGLIGDRAHMWLQ